MAAIKITVKNGEVSSLIEGIKGEGCASEKYLGPMLKVLDKNATPATVESTMEFYEKNSELETVNSGGDWCG